MAPILQNLATYGFNLNGEELILPNLGAVCENFMALKKSGSLFGLLGMVHCPLCRCYIEGELCSQKLVPDVEWWKKRLCIV